MLRLGKLGTNSWKRSLSDLCETHQRLQKRIRRQTRAGVCLKKERGKVVLMVLNFALLWSFEKPYLERVSEVVWVRSGLVKAFKGALPFSGSMAFKVCPDGNSVIPLQRGAGFNYLS